MASGGLQDVPDIPDFLKPGDSYLAPTSGFFFGQFTESPTLLGLLPPIELGHRLMHRYLEAVHPIARCVHRSSFEAIYTSFWEEVRQGIEPRASVQAVVFAAWFSAAVSVDDSFCRGQDCSKAQLVLHMKIGTETALSKANFLSTTRFETLQGFVMYLVSYALNCFLSKLTDTSFRSAETRFPGLIRSWSVPLSGWPSAWAFTAMALHTASPLWRRKLGAWFGTSCVFLMSAHARPKGQNRRYGARTTTPRCPSIAKRTN